MNDPRLWNAKKRSHDASQERHQKKRRTLKHYVERGGNPERWDVVDRIIYSDLLSSDDEEMENNDKVLESFSSSSPSSSTTTTTTSTSSVSKPPKQRKPRKPNPTTPMHERCLKCRLYKYNEQCSLTMCKACCAASPAACKYTHHRQAKVGLVNPWLLPARPLSLHHQLHFPSLTSRSNWSQSSSQRARPSSCTTGAPTANVLAGSSLIQSPLARKES